jgi:hypothetical protein
MMWPRTNGWQLNNPRHKEGKKPLRSDVGAGWERVPEVLPRATENATKHNGEQIPSVESLDTVPDDADNGSDGDEEISSVHSHNGSCKNRTTINQ